MKIAGLILMIVGSTILMLVDWRISLGVLLYFVGNYVYDYTAPTIHK